MPDPDRLDKIEEKTRQLEEQLARSEQMLEEVRGKLKAPRADPGSNGQVAKLQKDLEDQRQEFEALIGRLNEELQAVSEERDELAQRLESAAAFADDEPTDTHSLDDLHKKSG
jgi:predicted  nucleic acid-binding Zn-ribbon protein